MEPGRARGAVRLRSSPIRGGTEEPWPTRTPGEIIEEWRDQGIRFVRFELPDLHGTSRSKLIPIEHASAYAEDGLNMYGGAGVLDTRSDVVGGTLYNEEVAYGDQRLVPDPATAAVVPWAPDTARFICDSVWDSGESLGALPRSVLGRVLDSCRRLGLRAPARLRAGVLPPGRRDEGAALPGLSHLQHGAEHVRAVRPAARRAAPGLRLQHHHRELRVRGLAVGDQLHPRARHGRRGRDVHVQERGQGARAPERLLRDVHVEAVLGRGRLGNAHAREPPRRRRPERLRGRIGLGRDLCALPPLHRGQPPPRELGLRAPRPDRELPQATPAAHVQPVQRLLGSRGPLGARPHQGRLDRLPSRRAPGPDGAGEPVPLRRRDPRRRAHRHRGGAAARTARGRPGGGGSDEAPAPDERSRVACCARGGRAAARAARRRSSSPPTRSCGVTSCSASTTTSRTGSSTSTSRSSEVGP